ncbi:dipeptide/oligopeptide/nickel ABC transporter permease/ATP-binding protein [Sphaerimonospora thailandensis]|uniref:Peptide ABC transporter ATP-binding protein n=1 Tax=Sphaerimonospora thailandensis TaxID=795644 RepID=A0A8J3R5L3_9ACTN|nr:dipeptide/oligopeptide/nickel ABC transporter permease/ATP-binding protein [Sphaerimonospora thailandensis]GIH69671.1 peptide ABC transporter ATP-binding protein [Sphaerimonospora thailandensis]
MSSAMSTAESDPAADPAADSASAPAAEEPTPTGQMLRIWQRFRTDRWALIAAGYLGLLVVVAVFAPWLAPHDPERQDLLQAFGGPSWEHWLGTDELGRDELSRMLVATRISLLAVAEAVGIAVAVGVPIGLLAGFRGGLLDRIVMRLNDLVFAIPALVLVMLVIAVLGTGLGPSMAALGLVFSTGFIRVSRNAVTAIREETYLAAAQVIGVPTGQLVRRHVLPNALGPIMVQLALQCGVVLTIEASLSFIGLGAQPPDVSWGTLLAMAATSIQGADTLLVVWPGVAITVTVLALNLVGDGLLAALKPGRGRRMSRIRPGRRRRAETVPQPTPTATTTTTAATEPAREPDDAEPLLRVSGLTVTAGETRVVSDVSFDIAEGEVVGLVGESGCGKSTIALALMGLLDDQRRVAAGSIRLAGTELVGASATDWERTRGHGLAMVFQNPQTSLNPTMRIGDQIAEPLRLAGHSARTARAEAVALLEKVGVPDPARRARQYPHEFSGGMAQRAMIAMAIAGRPKLLIADEPVTALDVRVREQVLDLILDLRAEFGMAVLLVTHDLGVVADACDRTIVAYAGELVEQAPVEELFRAPAHPYTHGLLGARPVALTGRRLPTIPGSVPAPGQWPDGCRFQSRCAHAMTDCSAAAVPTITLTGDHRSRCLRAQEHPWL